MATGGGRVGFGNPYNQVVESTLRLKLVWLLIQVKILELRKRESCAHRGRLRGSERKKTTQKKNQESRIKNQESRNEALSVKKRAGSKQGVGRREQGEKRKAGRRLTLTLSPIMRLSRRDHDALGGPSGRPPSVKGIPRYSNFAVKKVLQSERL